MLLMACQDVRTPALYAWLAELKLNAECEIIK